MDSFFTWELLATYSGATTAVVIIVEVIKPAVKTYLPKVPTRAIVYLAALIIMVGTDLFGTPSTPTTSASLTLALLNSFGVALTAMGVYHQMLERMERRIAEKAERKVIAAHEAQQREEGTKP